MHNEANASLLKCGILANAAKVVPVFYFLLFNSDFL